MLNLCPTLCDPMDYRLSGSFVHGISQARIWEWVAIPFFSGSSKPRHPNQLACLAGGFWLSGKESTTGLICDSGRPPGEGNGNLLQYSCM